MWQQVDLWTNNSNQFCELAIQLVHSINSENNQFIENIQLRRAIQSNLFTTWTSLLPYEHIKETRVDTKFGMISAQHFCKVPQNLKCRAWIVWTFYDTFCHFWLWQHQSSFTVITLKIMARIFFNNSQKSLCSTD